MKRGASGNTGLGDVLPGNPCVFPGVGPLRSAPGALPAWGNGPVSAAGVQACLLVSGLRCDLSGSLVCPCIGDDGLFWEFSVVVEFPLSGVLRDFQRQYKQAAITAPSNTTTNPMANPT
mmetsp:Transcript_109064/g.211223  ORF Transcript_109064/g.211223 Transcript_109064/m.211223 type:complete len:119 (-) Transcript_109064:400-756(-)